MIRRTAGWLSIVAMFAALATAAAKDVAPAKKAPAVKDPVAPDRPTTDEEYQLHKLLVDTLDQVERNYVQEVSRRELIEAAIEGVLKELDPYSDYIDPKELTQFRNSVESEFGGIGIQITIEGDQLKVISPMVGTPAYEAGILAGDHIVEIDGEDTEGITLDEAVRRLKGKPGTSVKLTVVHPGRTERETIEVTRKTIRIDTVLGDHRKPDDSWDFMLDHQKRIGYVRLTAFSRETVNELRAALSELKQEKLRGLILDLRFNPGGLLSSAIAVADLFVTEGRIVSTSGRNSPQRSWDAHKKGTFTGFPMVVLVNRYSASASEIVAACLQDHDRAVVMGERTWGKGSVQNVIEMEEGRSALKLTTASYKRPSGENIHRFPEADDDQKWGVLPDEGYRLRLSDSELVALIVDRRERDVVLPHLEELTEEAGDGAAPETETDTAGDPAGQDDGEESGEGKPADTTEEPADDVASAGSKPVVDRVLRMAVDYLSSEVARADVEPPAEAQKASKK
jgi:carboxyl-terminal processing protease